MSLYPHIPTSPYPSVPAARLAPLLAPAALWMVPPPAGESLLGNDRTSAPPTPGCAPSPSPTTHQIPVGRCQTTRQPAVLPKRRSVPHAHVRTAPGAQCHRSPPRSAAALESVSQRSAPAGGAVGRARGVPINPFTWISGPRRGSVGRIGVFSPPPPSRCSMKLRCSPPRSSPWSLGAKAAPGLGRSERSALNAREQTLAALRCGLLRAAVCTGAGGHCRPSTAPAPCRHRAAPCLQGAAVLKWGEMGREQTHVPNPQGQGWETTLASLRDLLHPFASHCNPPRPFATLGIRLQPFASH